MSVLWSAISSSLQKLTATAELTIRVSQVMPPGVNAVLVHRSECYKLTNFLGSLSRRSKVIGVVVIAEVV